MTIGMKHIIPFVAAALMVSSCTITSSLDDDTVAPVSYVIDGSEFTGNISNEFIYNMLDLAYSGHVVVFGSDVKNNVQAGNPVTYTYSTSNREAAFRWARRMSHGGFTIKVSYNKKTAKYYCIATKG